MNDQEIQVSVHQLAGYWPAPPISDDETLAIGATLAQYDRREFNQAVDLLGLQLRQFRPSPAEIVTALRSVRRHADERRPGLPPAPPAANPIDWLNQCRRQLEETPHWRKGS